MSTRTPRPPVERLADRYDLGPVIGRGGMGQVRRARDTRLGRDVAIKVLHLGVGTPADRQRFEREARAAARVNHPNVVAVYDVGEQDDEVFIVMECLPGNTLADEIARGPLPVDRVAHVGADLLRALAAAHAHGILHRDIKPSNVLFASDGTAKLGDFGIAKMGDDTDLTEVGSIVGTAPYLAPERLSGEPASAAGDLYSVGVLLYEALTGTRPFAGASAIAVAHAMSRTTPAPIDAVRPDCPPGLAASVARAMRKDPADRFASAASMAASLAGGSDTRPLAPSPALTQPGTAPLLAPAPPAGPAVVASAATVRDAAPLAPTVAFPVADGGTTGSRARGGIVLAALAALVVGILVVGLLAARPGTDPEGPPATAVATDSSTPAPETTAVPPSSTAPTTTVPTTAVTPTPSKPAPVTTPAPRPGKGKDKGGKDD